MPLTNMRRAISLLLMLLPAACAAPPVTDCKLTKVAEMPLRVEDHLLVVPVGINGHWVRLIVDTGAERTTISKSVAARIGLRQDAKFVARSVGIGGATTEADAVVPGIVIGGVRFPVSHIAVGDFTLRNKHGLDVDGLLGSDILLAFDLDIDVPGQRLTLYRPRRCPGATPPWRQPALEVTGVSALKDRLLVPFVLDDIQATAVLDTGAQGNLLGISLAHRMHISNDALSMDPVVHSRGTGGTVTSHLHRFYRLRVGPVTIENPRVVILPTDLGRADAIIGEPFLEGRRVWLSFPNRRLFVTARADGS